MTSSLRFKSAGVVFLCLALCMTVFSVPGFAAEKGADGLYAPTRAELIAHWESSIKENPHTLQFEKTEDAGVYAYATDFFPYKGRLRLLNAVIVPDSDTYYDDVYGGIIELELVNADDAFLKKFSRSYYAWGEQNNFYFDAQNNVWFPASGSSKYLSNRPEPMTAQDLPSAVAAACPLWKDPKIWRSVLPIGFFLLIVLALLFFARKQNKRIWDNHAQALAEQQRGLTMVQESLQHQREHTKLLQNILAALRERH